MNVSTYLFGSSLLAVGLNWWHATLAVFLGNLMVLAPLLLNGYAGTKYGIAFPVFLRSSFGRRGAVVAALSRGIVAIGWFAFNVWLGAQAIHAILLALLPFLESIDFSLGTWMGLSLLQLVSFVAFLAVHMLFVYKGIESMKVFEVVTAPLLGVSALALLVWAWTATGSLSAMLDATNQFENSPDNEDESAIGWLFRVFLPGLTAMVGAWSTMALNILDFTRFAKSQKAQIVGQSLGLPIPTTLFAFIGIAVTGATTMLYGKPLWQPSELFDHFPTVWRIVANLVMVFSVLAMNITANLVSPANDFSNINPDLINFKMGGYITGVAGLLIFPWKLFSDANDFIFIWLIGYSAVLGAIAGVMLCDFHILKRRELVVEELYFDPAKGGDENLSNIETRDPTGEPSHPDNDNDNDSGSNTSSPHSRYGAITASGEANNEEDEERDPVVPGVGIYEYWRGWNVKAGVAVALGLLPCLPGFLVAVGLLPAPDADTASPALRLIVGLYHYAWFVAIGISFVSYYLLMTCSAWEGQARYEQRLATYRQQHRRGRGRRGEECVDGGDDDGSTTTAATARKRGGGVDDGEGEEGVIKPMGGGGRQRPEARTRRRRGGGGGKSGPSSHTYAQPDNQPRPGGGDDSSDGDGDSDSDGGDRYTSSDLRDYVAGARGGEPSEGGYAESPTIEKHQKEQRREQRRRSRRLVAQWRQRQKERAEASSNKSSSMTAATKGVTLGKGTIPAAGGDEASRRYVFFEEEGDDARARNEEEDKNARSHFVEYTEEEYEEMQQSLVREGMMSPPDSETEGRWRLAGEKHLSI